MTRMRPALLLLALVLLARPSFSQNNAPPAPTPPVAPKATAPVKTTRAAVTSAELQKTVDQLTQSNRDLLDLLKKQQEVLQDIQFESRVKNRQIQSLEERLEDTLYQNTQLQKKMDKLEADASVRPQGGSVAAVPTAVENSDATNSPPPQSAPPPIADTTPPPPPETYLPKPESEGAPGTMSWHRLFTLKGDDAKQTDLFHIQGRTWRVLWHNQDKAGKVYANTSALFINAFPKDDTIPQKVCSKLGSGGDSSELQGPGNYYLKVEASGGSWELAVEDFR
jgi:hypothetical protein